MKAFEFVRQHPHRGDIQQTCAYIDKGAHKLMLMSQRQHMTVTELHAQVEVVQKWLRDVDDWLTQAPPHTEDS